MGNHTKIWILSIFKIQFDFILTALEILCCIKVVILIRLFNMENNNKTRELKRVKHWEGLSITTALFIISVNKKLASMVVSSTIPERDFG